MKLYHGTNQDIETIDLTRGMRHKDFGKGVLSDTRQEYGHPHGTEEGAAFRLNDYIDYLRTG